jgi:hypothetical protein
MMKNKQLRKFTICEKMKKTKEGNEYVQFSLKDHSRALIDVIFEWFG